MSAMPLHDFRQAAFEIRAEHHELLLKILKQARGIERNISGFTTSYDQLNLVNWRFKEIERLIVAEVGEKAAQEAAVTE